MSEFTPITTQEQFDAAIGERLKRERESLAKKYGDYDALKQKTDDYERQIAEYSKSLEAAKQAASAHDQVVTELNAKLKGYESASVKTRIAHEFGIPYELASRLSGEDEDAIRKDAETLSQLIGQQARHKAPPLRSTEPLNLEGDATKAALKRTLRGLDKGD